MKGENIIGPRAERGLGYVALGSAEDTVSFQKSLAVAHRAFLWITERGIDGLPDGGRAIRVTTLPEKNGTVDPKRLGDLRAAALAFVTETGTGWVLLDCLGYLVLHNGAERVLRALADLHDEVTMHGGSLVVFVDARVTSPRLVAWLERELDILPSLAPATWEAGLLSA